ncbi:Atg14 domain-containing protein [Peptococcaceae bacterium]|nr:Atg14 domain-containing protein [Peptococcaceae bacterium]
MSEHGLDLLFKTKEIYNELQISIAQLYLRQQIQKGVFDGALRSIDELDLAVRKRKQRIQQLERKIIKDVLYVAREDELKKQIDSINEQLEREKKYLTNSCT